MDLAREQRILRAIDEITYLFKADPTFGSHLDDPHLLARHHEDRHHSQVRVFLLRSIGWSYVRINRRHAIPARTAQRWQRAGKGKGLLDFAVREKRIEPRSLLELLTNASRPARGFRI